MDKGKGEGAEKKGEGRVREGDKGAKEVGELKEEEEGSEKGHM